jgi:signal peptidase I
MDNEEFDGYILPEDEDDEYVDYAEDEADVGYSEDDTEYEDGEYAEEGAYVEDEAAAAAVRQRYPGEGAYDWVQCLVAALLFCVILFSFFMRIIGIIGPSMQPTFHDKDRVLISDLFFEPKYGDVVVLRKQEYQQEPIIKRVIATAGQVVDIDFDEGTVYVDGEPLDEPYTADKTFSKLDFEGPVVVPENCVFVMGDNRNNSSDSREARISMVDRRFILGKVLLRVFPISQFGVVE